VTTGVISAMTANVTNAVVIGVTAMDEAVGNPDLATLMEANVPDLLGLFHRAISPPPKTRNPLPLSLGRGNENFTFCNCILKLPCRHNC
jgi:copper homeostasis protein CutC